MATASGETRCAQCTKQNATLKCQGCLQTFCSNHMADHRQQLNNELTDIAVRCDFIRETLTEQTTDSQKHPLMQKISQWEEESVAKIRQTAEEARQLLVKHTIGPIAEVEVKLSKLTDQIRKSRTDNDFFENDLQQWKEKLTKLKDKLPLTSSNITIREDSTPFVSRIYVDLSGKDIHSLVPQLSVIDINNNSQLTRWTQNGITIAGGHGSGHGFDQLYNPLGICIDDIEDNPTIYVADYWNNRIIQWRSGMINGEIVVNGSMQTNQTDQINRPTNVLIDKRTDSLIICDTGNRRVVQYPRRHGSKARTIISDIDCWGVAMDKHGYLYVSDCNRHEVKRWRIGETSWKVVAGGNGSGHRLDQLNYPTYLFVDDEQSIYVSDRDNHRVMKWKSDRKQGVIVAGSQTEGNSLEQLSHPTGIVVDHLGTVYVADSNNHRVMRWPKDAIEGSIAVGGNTHGNQPNQLYNPRGISFDRQGNLYVADNANHRIQKFNVDLNLIKLL